MTLSHLIAILTALSLNANPSPHAIPATLQAATLPAQTTADAPAPPAVPTPPIKRHPESLGVVVTGRSAVVADVASGAVLFAKDAEVVRPIASLTKLLTAMVVLDQGLRDTDSIRVEVADIVDARPLMMVGDTLTRRDALRAMLTGSVNELANAFARTSEGGRVAFIEAMNAKARQIGLTRTTIEEPTGVNPRNRSTAKEIALLVRAALGYPEIREMTTSAALDVQTVTDPTVAVSKKIRVKPTNLLLTSYLNKDPYKIIAGKTGSLPEAGFCLAQVTQNADGKQIIAVTLASTDHFSRFQDVKAMTAWAFQTYQWGE